MNPARPHLLAPLTMIGSILVLGSIMITRKPEVAPVFGFAMGILPIAWFLIEKVRFRGELDESAREDRMMVRNSVAAAGLMMAVPLGLTVLFTSGITAITDDFEQRAMGIVFGMVFAAYGNFVPKRPVSLSKGECSPAGQQAFNRFSGLMFMLTGLAYAGVWIFVPLDYALPASMAVLLTGVGIPMLRAAVLFLNRRR